MTKNYPRIDNLGTPTVPFVFLLKFFHPYLLTFSY